MAARRAWVVFVDDGKHLEGDHDVGGMYKPLSNEISRQYLSVFFREHSAIDAAKYLAQKNPGKDVHILRQSIGFCCQSKPMEQKEWTEDGAFVPVTK